jgi:hypothetical protein
MNMNMKLNLKQVYQSLVRFLNKPLCSCNWKVWIGLVLFGLLVMRLSTMIIPWVRQQWRQIVNVVEGMENKTSVVDYKQIRDDEDKLTHSNTTTDANSNSPLGIPKSEIPDGQEDLYILKSQVVPPVCPACPPVIERCKNEKDKCPPCRPCGRCPEPDFECKKVPNYSNAQQNNYLPRPVLSDFSQFGM